MADLSRSAQQILDEAWGSPWEADDLDLADVEVIVAYALRAAALYCTRDHLILLALAEELEGRAARRPKPPSLKEQALMALEDGDTGPGASLTSNEVDIIRRALEQLP
jgi:hypothetical protein